jgi:hypothetical protein
VLVVCAKADENVSPAERIYFAAAQNDSSDEEISLLLAISASPITPGNFSHFCPRNPCFIK